MKYLILILLTACGMRKPCNSETVWANQDGQQFTQGCGQITYFRPTPKCQLVGQYQSLDSGWLAWELKETCANNAKVTTPCYLEYRDLEAELSCPDLGIHAIFERVN